MSQTRADTLTITFDRTRRTRRRTYSGGVTYGLTWNRLTVTPTGGETREYDRLNITSTEATTRAAA